MSADWDQMIVAATLDDISNGSAIYLQVGAAALLNELRRRRQESEEIC